MPLLSSRRERRQKPRRVEKKAEGALLLLQTDALLLQPDALLLQPLTPQFLTPQSLHWNGELRLLPLRKLLHLLKKRRKNSRSDWRWLLVLLFFVLVVCLLCCVALCCSWCFCALWCVDCGVLIVVFTLRCVDVDVLIVVLVSPLSLGQPAMVRPAFKFGVRPSLFSLREGETLSR